MPWRWFLLSLLTATFIAFGWIWIEPWFFPASEAHEKTELASVQPATVLQPGTQVLISGAIKKPGLYRIPKGSLVYDLIQIAGGLTPEAEVSQKLLETRVPEQGEVKIPAAQPPAPSAETSADEPAPKSRKKTTRNRHKASSSQASPVRKLDLNRATAAELESLPGVGPKMAQRILAWRKAHGEFSSVDELTQVKGIGKKRLKELRRYFK
ncbi:hypothetical protein COW36_24150 [bacterium (Candidatus Blackallbacteria) CG17_big_fil_post_rev_8_21_14_2_50_48_46]|uniref:Helix-hairpin-helix DNA-binding motif class 1 domain-containing protein n=1 Tax=bacterium (Candidatus Blackallbacteria) CG17_big_fil_post_rev_8_21_14_2_50_48_46 TaxID=2014261 RepID=A0A2M7FXP3_9BACT|nr:MAG: hypothetical protein COW64_19090 [bacterium (Candidatus Blackallbacteria) CG18_big_fil_WC_8_21_14_2_50_49_26]PIW13763.1 MAG: hypothetical protein COW36_24150 [bacterium (Candidatus Blackallbacteria) CG17_big_fil_post_rev_8_21_14_2_50_48_46]PIW44989.1 MAG: hypothetical protein COW20_21780 [bacterium (Candidatus Blackallbacteria) CG13_big_fil_rev_8_21_14_2_50_49_14]